MFLISATTALSWLDSFMRQPCNLADVVDWKN